VEVKPTALNRIKSYLDISGEAVSDSLHISLYKLLNGFQLTTPTFLFNSRITPMACTGFYEFHLLHGLPGSLLPLGLYQRACFGFFHPYTKICGINLILVYTDYIWPWCINPVLYETEISDSSHAKSCTVLRITN
jgi:hypothetical protein